MISVLIVDDEGLFLRTLQLNLRASGYFVTPARDAAQALAAVEAQTFDLIVLDLGLPDLDGIELIGKVRALTGSPIIVLSARHTSDDKVEALDAGADDYMTKPFGLDELLARLRTALRHQGVPDGPQVVASAAFTVDLRRSQVFRGNSVVRLTPTEWKILELLVRNPGRLLPREKILVHVWGPAYATETAYLRVYMTQLRRKLEPVPSAPRHLITEPGRGYRFEP